MKTKLFSCIAFLVVFLTLAFWLFQASKTASEENNTNTLVNSDREVARLIAEKTCIKGGANLNGDAGTYNEATKTWWFNANLNATKPGCNPACVVSMETKTAEINWRCTGAIPPEQPPIVGGDSDVHGCKASAGYSWCETKQKCLRIWEDPCDTAPVPVSQKISCPSKTGEQMACTALYQPVCAKIQVQCIKAPCPPKDHTFGNSCTACQNPLVTEYTEGECTKQ